MKIQIFDPLFLTRVFLPQRERHNDEKSLLERAEMKRKNSASRSHKSSLRTEEDGERKKWSASLWGCTLLGSYGSVSLSQAAAAAAAAT